MSHPYHHHVHYRPRCGGFFKGVLLVGLGFWIARATERRHHLEGPRHFPPPNSNVSSSTATPAENSEGVWGRRGWCRRRREEMMAGGQGPSGPVVYGAGEVRGEDVPAVLAALAAFQRAHPEAAQGAQPQQAAPATTLTPPTTTSPVEEVVIEKATGEAPAAVEAIAVDKAKLNEELERIDRMAAALQKLREAIEKDEPPRLV